MTGSNANTEAGGMFGGGDVIVKPLEMSADEIATFISDVYDRHPHGKSFVPRWQGSFLKHIIFDHPDFTPDHALGAFVGGTLVGLILAQPYAVTYKSQRMPCIYGSWLAVQPGGAGYFAAVKLVNELKTRHKARGAKFMVGVSYRSGAGVGLDFWEGYARAFPNDFSKFRDLPYWARVLDGDTFAGAVSDPLLKMGAHAARMNPVREPKADPGIRSYSDDDFEACQKLLANADALITTAPTPWELRSAPTLDHGPQTIVRDRGNGVNALAMFHILPMTDAAPLRVGMIDHLVDDTSGDGRRDILGTVLWRLKQAGACLALVPQKPYINSASMMFAGFIPYSAEFKIFLMPYSDDTAIEMPASYDLLVR